MKVKNSRILYILIIIFVLIILVLNYRRIKYELMMFIYQIYSLYGTTAWNNKYPIDYPYDREDIIPDEYMLEFNHICYYRQLTGDNEYKVEEMKKLITRLENYCSKNLTIQKPKQLAILYPFSNEEDLKTMQFYIEKKYPFVIRGGNWKTNKKEINIDKIIDKYGETTVLFNKENNSFSGKLKEIKTNKAYLSNSTSFMRKHPEIMNLNDIDILKEMSGLNLSISQLFLSLVSNNGTTLHSAFSHNFYFMIEGKKKWSFWHPDYLCLVYPYFPENGVYFASYTGIYDNLDENIKTKYKLLQYAPSYEIILEEGDVLYNPGPWWHAILNKSEKSFAIATRWEYDELIPSPNQLRYCQISNKNIYTLFKEIFINTGSFKFDIDENYKNEMNSDSLTILEILNHDSLQILKNEDRYLSWKESFMNMFESITESFTTIF